MGVGGGCEGRLAGAVYGAGAGRLCNTGGGLGIMPALILAGDRRGVGGELCEVCSTYR